MRKIFEVIVLVALLQSGIAGCGTVGGILVFDPINYVGSSSGPNVDWNRAPLSVVKRSAYLDRRLQEAQRDYDAAKNAMRGVILSTGFRAVPMLPQFSAEKREKLTGRSSILWSGITVLSSNKGLVNWVNWNFTEAAGCGKSGTKKEG